MDNDDNEDDRAALERIDPAFLLPLTFDPRPAPAETAEASSSAAAEEHDLVSDVDLRVFRLAAAQTGLALENSHLLAHLAAEIAAREKHRRELEIARDVQQRLFPQDHPPVAGLEYAGACRPALEVGGDYYDFITISAREFGIAIGDVSGKGVPASLLMATLRAYLRGQTAGREDNLPALMANLNRFVYDSSPANRYATFFYAQHDASTRIATYVNAGHNPPLLFRTAGVSGDADPIRLYAGGPVIGLLPECGYVQGQVVLSPGDLLVAFTDGVSEAINGDKEWGEEHLIDAIRRHRDVPVDALIVNIMASVDAFVGDVPQYDDMTLVVVRAV